VEEDRIPRGLVVEEANVSRKNPTIPYDGRHV